MTVDVGANGSSEWSYDGSLSGTDEILHVDGLVDAINGYRSGVPGEEVTIPIRLTSNTEVPTS